VFAALELVALVSQPALVQLVAVMRIYRLLCICISYLCISAYVSVSASESQSESEPENVAELALN